MSNAYAYSESKYMHAHTHTRAQVGRSYFAERCPAQPHNLPRRQRQRGDEGGASVIPPLCVQRDGGRTTDGRTEETGKPLVWGLYLFRIPGTAIA